MKQYKANLKPVKALESKKCYLYLEKEEPSEEEHHVFCGKGSGPVRMQGLGRKAVVGSRAGLR